MQAERESRRSVGQTGVQETGSFVAGAVRCGVLKNTASAGRLVSSEIVTPDSRPRSRLVSSEPKSLYSFLIGCWSMVHTAAVPRRASERAPHPPASVWAYGHRFSENSMIHEPYGYSGVCHRCLESTAGCRRLVDPGRGGGALLRSAPRTALRSRFSFQQGVSHPPVWTLRD
jgi:hypothetical protein